MIPSLETERMWARPVLLAVNLTDIVGDRPTKHLRNTSFTHELP